MINKLTVDKGAIFDYEEIVCKIPFSKETIRRAVEKKLDKVPLTKTDLRLPFYDKDAKKDLLLFIRKGYAFGIMQMWILRGICNKEDYEEEMENNGIIKDWLEVIIE